MTDEEQRKVFGKNLKHWLTVRGVKQVDLANQLNVTEGTVSQWISGRNMPKMGKVQKITDILDINKSDLYDDKPFDDSADALRDRVFARSPALFKMLDTASPDELKQIEKIVNAILDETNN